MVASFPGTLRQYGTEPRGIPRQSLNVRGRIGIMCITALAVIAVIAVSLQGGQSATELQSSQTIEFSSGNRAVLSGHDFVPLSNAGKPHSAEAQMELRKLYAAAGMKMRAISFARQQQLAEVSYAPEIKAHTEIDPGSNLRLRAAAHGDLKAFSRRIGTGAAELQEEAARHALGSTIARYFKNEQKL